MVAMPGLGAEVVCKKAKELDVAALVVFKHSKAWWHQPYLVEVRLWRRQGLRRVSFSNE